MANTLASIAGGGSTVDTCASAPGGSRVFLPASSRQQRSPSLAKRSQRGSENLSPFCTRFPLKIEQIFSGVDIEGLLMEINEMVAMLHLPTEGPITSSLVSYIERSTILNTSFPCASWHALEHTWYTVGGRNGFTDYMVDRIGTSESRAYTCDARTHKEFCTYVVLSGNTTMLQGLSVRMPNELTAPGPSTTPVKGCCLI